MKTLIFGHKNPDTDSVMSSLIMADYCEKMGIDATACMLGETSLETQYILEYLNIEAPMIIKNVDEGQKVIMVDHNEFGQSVDGIEHAIITHVVDHHRVANFNTASPLEMRLMPVGCTATVLYTLYEENNLDLENNIAIMMISAICSDTLIFKSPTTTAKDEEVARKLAKKVGIDIETYAMEMLKAGTNLSSKTDKEVMSIDSKQFTVGETLYEVAQVNTADIDGLVASRLSGFVDVMEEKIESDNLGLFLLMITDIVNSNSLLIPKGDEEAIKKFEQNFNIKLENGQVLLEGVVSRKKQIVPNLK